MSNFKFDNHGQLPTGLTEVTNTTGKSERIYTHEEIQQVWDNIKTAMAPILKNLVKAWDEICSNRELMETIAQHQAIDQGHRYWTDFTGQPRRNPTMRPLLHNGKAPR